MCKPMYEKYYYHIQGDSFKVNREYGEFETKHSQGFNLDTPTNTSSSTAIVAIWDVEFDD